MESVLSVEHGDDGTATLWLDRPGSRNAMGRAFFDQLPVLVRELSEDPAVRVVIIAARGPHFTVGLDLKEMGGLLAGTPGTGTPGTGTESALPSPAAKAAATRASIVRMQGAITAVADCPKPVIAAVHGYCIGGGMDLVTACDIRLASADAIFSVRETRIAIVADLGTLQRLPKIVGAGHAAELALTGKDIDAGRAQEIGLVNHVLADPDALSDAAREMAREIAALSPLAVQGTKAVLAANEGRTVEQGLEYVATWNAAMLGSEDLMEAVRAFVEKRTPRFTGN